MGKVKDKLEWFSDGAKEGAETTKLAGQAIGAVIGLAMVGAVVGIASSLFGGSK